MIAIRTCVTAVAAAVLLPASGLAADTVRTEAETIRIVTVTPGLAHPWGLAFLPDGRMLVTERTGKLRIVGRDGKLAPQPVAGLPKIEEYGQGGLLDVALHPRFSENGLVYIAFAARGEGGVGTEVARGTLSGGRLENVQVIFRQQPKSGGGRHLDRKSVV